LERQARCKPATIKRRVAALKTDFDFLAEDSGECGITNFDRLVLVSMDGSCYNPLNFRVIIEKSPALEKKYHAVHAGSPSPYA
jgi:hypothetical protein